MKNTGLKNLPTSSEGFPCISVGKESACSARDLGLIPGSDPWVGEDPLEKEMATHSSILEEPDGL